MFSLPPHHSTLASAHEMDQQIANQTTLPLQLQVPNNKSAGWDVEWGEESMSLR